VIIADSTTLAQGGMLAVIAGLCYALTGVMLKLGHTRGLAPVQIILISTGLAAVVYGVYAAHILPGGIPPIVWILALAVGLSQYVLQWLLNVAMKLGPLSAMWCAMSLLFVPVIIYSYLVLDKGLTALQLIGACAAIGCVVTASVARHRPAPGADLPAGAAKPRGKALVYLGVLVMILLINGIANIAQFDLSQRITSPGVTLLDRYWACYYFIFFASVAVAAFIELTLRRKLLVSVRRAWPYGLVAGAGAGTGLYILGRASTGDGSIAFAICGATGILATAAVGAAFFQEKRSLAWYATVALGIAAVILGNLKL